MHEAMTNLYSGAPLELLELLVLLELFELLELLELDAPPAPPVSPELLDDELLLMVVFETSVVPSLPHPLATTMVAVKERKIAAYLMRPTSS